MAVGKGSEIGWVAWRGLYTLNRWKGRFPRWEGVEREGPRSCGQRKVPARLW